MPQHHDEAGVRELLQETAHLERELRALRAVDPARPTAVEQTLEHRAVEPEDLAALALGLPVGPEEVPELGIRKREREAHRAPVGEHHEVVLLRPRRLPIVELSDLAERFGLALLEPRADAAAENPAIEA